MSQLDVDEMLARKAARGGSGSGPVTGDAEAAELDTQYFEAGDVNFQGDGTRIIVDNTVGTISLDGVNGVFINGVEIVP